MDIDHIVFISPTLQDGIDIIHQSTGYAPQYSGKHLHDGTHNALLRIDERSYLEVLSVDPANENISAPRWMGVDLIEGSGMISRIALQSANIAKDGKLLDKFGSSYSKVYRGSRKTNMGDQLEWKMTKPLPEPLIDPIPFLVEWAGDFHPTLTMEQHFRIQQLTIYTTQRDSVNFLEGLCPKIKVVRSPKDSFALELWKIATDEIIHII